MARDRRDFRVFPRRRGHHPNMRHDRGQQRRRVGGGVQNLVQLDELLQSVTVAAGNAGVVGIEMAVN